MLCKNHIRHKCQHFLHQVQWLVRSRSCHELIWLASNRHSGNPLQMWKLVTKQQQNAPIFVRDFILVSYRIKQKPKRSRSSIFKESAFIFFTESVCFQNLVSHILHRICFSIFFKESSFHILQRICFHVLHRIWLSPYSSKNLSVFMFFTESGCFHILQRIYLFSCSSQNLVVSIFFKESIYRCIYLFPCSSQNLFSSWLFVLM